MQLLSIHAVICHSRKSIDKQPISLLLSHTVSFWTLSVVMSISSEGTNSVPDMSASTSQLL